MMVEMIMVFISRLILFMSNSSTLSTLNTLPLTLTLNMNMSPMDLMVLITNFEIPDALMILCGQ